LLLVAKLPRCVGLKTAESLGGALNGLAFNALLRSKRSSFLLLGQSSGLVICGGIAVSASVVVSADTNDCFCFFAAFGDCDSPVKRFLEAAMILFYL
jgi:hypothetical protein